MIFDVAFWIIQGQCNAANPQSTYQQPLLAKMLFPISHPPPTIERPRSINSVFGGSASYTALKGIVPFLN